MCACADKPICDRSIGRQIDKEHIMLEPSMRFCLGSVERGVLKTLQVIINCSQIRELLC